ncbi:MAG TPA: T9SS type A sorting domain-containing protein [Flavobacteriaceae bacterium]|nr:T9SS type A sorting domain-containing protein [Flavobacteriaceae bacterium]MCB9212646.1 T9SS type A sorting domain-containing protein [Alteromonas sp.]HPF11493.1 T9SS type A sorting domain-containing protein [Flavobacteriaceae bacterium]HQU21026.1 T9SS type A sorting domain-containing protein [Flavobacteriaceae bacterium]HQU65927.1 T9SS type A sorting domain-containing protein [Flavobacteriaceae bacterium]
MKILGFFIFIFLPFLVYSQTINFPDSNFKNALIEDGVDTNNDGEIQVSEAEAVNSLQINQELISDLTGIAYFVNVEVLDCSGNQLTTVDLSNNLALSVLSISDNQLTELILGANTNLLQVEASGNFLSSIDLSQAENLSDLQLGANQFTSIDLSNNHALNELRMGSNQLTSIDLTGNLALEILAIENNSLDALNLTANINLQGLNCLGNGLTSLLLPANCISEIDCSNNNLESLTIPNGSCLYVLSCNDNNLANLDFGNGAAPFFSLLYCYNNQLSSLDLFGMENLSVIHAYNNQLTELDLSGTPNASSILLSNNALTSIDLTGVEAIGNLDVSNNQLTSIDFSTNYSVQSVECSNNHLTELVFDHEMTLSNLFCSFNDLTSLDLGKLPFLDYFIVGDNPNLAYVILKNGNNDNFGPSVIGNGFNNLDNLQIVCVDDENSIFANLLQDFLGPDVVITDFCSFLPGDDYSVVTGKTRVDSNQNGCDPNDLSYPHMGLFTTNGINNETFYSNGLGNFIIPLADGDYTVAPLIENPTYYTVSPANVAISFPTDPSPFEQDFCAVPNGIFNDLEIIILPLTDARPGFDAEYRVFYRNKGTTSLTANITLTYQDDYMDLISSSVTPSSQGIGILEWNGIFLNPMEEGQIDFSMALNPPTDPNFPLNGNDMLTFLGAIDPVINDETPEDNEFELQQIVVSSLDPNDITCLQGMQIEFQEVGDYVHYLIRFENVGTANAINVKISNQIDINQLDPTSMIPIQASHDMIASSSDQGLMEFIFEDINLPYNDENDDGFVLYKIKTKSDLEIGDVFTNQAEIFFDFNSPIATNIAATEVVNNLSANDFRKLNVVKLFPNPTKGGLTIAMTHGTIYKIVLCDILGNEIMTIEDEQRQAFDLDVSKLSHGIYFVSVNDETPLKLIKN